MQIPPRDGLFPVRLHELDLSDEELVEEAIISARAGVAATLAAGAEPTPAMLARAAGDPELVAAFIAQVRRERAQADVA